MAILNGLATGVLIACVTILALYAIRHYMLVLWRLGPTSPQDPMELTGFVLPKVSVLVPMYNEERVAADIVEALAQAEYDRSLLEVIFINDRSTDSTGEILDELTAAHGFMTVLHRRVGSGGKAHALEHGTQATTGEILLIFDADYVPGRATLQQLVAPFCDPQVGAVMGRVVPENAHVSALSALLELERAAGYQVGQQARQRLGLTPQFGGTVGGVRRTALAAVGGWNKRSLTEDTDLTFRLLLNGWKVAYVNRAECYEEAPESWTVRRRQISRWATGHTECFHAFWRDVVRSRALRFREKVDALFVLGCYLTAPIIVLAWASSLWLVMTSPGAPMLSFVVAVGFIGFQLFGSQATLLELGVASFLDRNRYRVLLLPASIPLFFNSTLAICAALLKFYGGEIYGIGRRQRRWHKTARYRTNGNGRRMNGNGNGNGNGRVRYP